MVRVCDCFPELKEITEAPASFRKTRVPWQEPYCSNLSSQRCNRPSPDTTYWSGAIGIRRLVLCQATLDLDSSKRMRLLRWSVLRLWR